MKASPFTALLSPHRQRRRPFPSIGLFWPSPRQSIEGGREGNGRHVDHFINQAPPRRRRRRRQIAREEGASEPAADSQQLVKHFSRGQSRIPELRGAHAAPRRTRPRPAAPPDAWVGLAAEPAEIGGRPPIGEPLLQGPVGGLDGGVAARAALAGEGPPDIERLRQAADAGVREPAAAESGSAPIPSTAFAPPSSGRLPWADRPLRTRRGEAAKRRMRPRPDADCLDAPERVRRGLAMPMRGGARFPPGRPNGAGESGRTRKGRRPAPAPPNETSRFQGRRARASQLQRPRTIAPRGPSFPSREAKKEGPAVSGGPLGYPWWSLGGSNP